MLVLRTIDEDIERVHKVHIKAKEYKRGKKGYQINKLTEDEISCIWEALSAYESMLKYKKEEKDV